MGRKENWKGERLIEAQSVRLTHPYDRPYRSRMSLSVQILISLVFGIVTGLFLGELASPLKIIGDAFVLLLQMAVLPYLSVSLMAGLGSLKAEGAAALALRAGSFLLLLWGVALVSVLLIPMGFPNWESSSFFSTNLVEPSSDFDFLKLFIPSNPFRSLADAVVPSVVVFSLALGVALIGLEGKEGLIRGLETLREALSRITTFVVRLAPIGIFGIASNAAGTISLDQAISLQVYMLVYAVSALALALWTLPALVAALTPYRWGEIMRHSQSALITAFATGSVFVVLSMLAARSKEMVSKVSDDPARDEHRVDVVMPVIFTFPSAGTLLSLSFILFAAWLSGSTIAVSQYPNLLLMGVSSFFGSTMVAVPFLLDLFQIPADTFQLFLVANNIVGNRFGAMLACMHLVAVTLLSVAAMSGKLRFSAPAILRYLVITGLITIVPILAVRFGFEQIEHEYEGYDRFVQMQPLFEKADSKVFEDAPRSASAEDVSITTLDRVVERGSLRVGYLAGRLPWVFRNSSGELVGFDVEMAHALARELGVRVEFYPVKLKNMSQLLDTGRLDVIMSGVPLTTSIMRRVSFSASYIDETLAFVVRDHDRDKFASQSSVQQLDAPKIASPNLPYYLEKLRHYVPQAEITIIDSPRDFFRAEPGTYDALLFSAESGSAWSLVYPAFTVAVPRPTIRKVPLAYAIRKGDEEMVSFLSNWILLKQRDLTISQLFNHWILGQALENKEPRWSIIRDVLGWVK